MSHIRPHDIFFFFSDHKQALAPRLFLLCHWHRVTSATSLFDLRVSKHEEE
jgi:hypothetical protein